MARGKQKEQAREKAQKLAESKKGGQSQLGARAAGLKINCPVCKNPASNYNVLKVHMEAKHPKDTVPPESSFSS
ncbi:hypothetical protein IWQ60_002165 [Tieghemiomyces parasiticus]|uniref:Small EDRK-rich factor-like N-terminal domain-containing protein n=1 Tax=Tieghemiomyces parasiticus TaxID=78921 RepID=A0A9W8AD76_9FUNG|nr:hypothetical protein IWQ60_002165 [Tieghemiomyces parasiticus]